MICFFFLNGAPPIRLNIFGAPPSFVAAARCKIKKNVIYVIGK